MENIINEMAKQSLVNQFNPISLNYPNYPTYKPDVAYANDCGVIGICYVPVQKWEQIYDEDTGFSVGTIFPSLNLPFLGGGR